MRQGDTISHYTILEEIGKGGMGVVYRARDSRLERDVALKFLPDQVTPDSAEAARFIREARAASALSHPNIAHVYDIGEEEERMFIAMEYVAGVSLADHLKENDRLSIDSVIDYIEQIATGLQAAHDKGIVHRDVKPANLIITEDGNVKIIDFGLAKLADDSHLTKEQSTIGTVAYMSPEQTQGGDVDARSDVWSLAVVAYEMLCGQRPFRGSYDQAVIYSILNEEPESAMSTNPQLTGAVDVLFAKALAKDPDSRYQKASDFSDALRVALRGQILDESLAMSPIALKWVKVAVIVAVLSALTMLIWTLFPPGRLQTDAQIDSIAVLPLRNLSEDPEQDYFVDGLTEELITALGNLEGVRVPARTSSFAFKDTDLDIQEVADQLNVSAVLEGSVRKFENRMRLNASLVNAQNGFQIWGETYERDLSDIFSVQRELSSSISEALQIQLEPGASEGVTVAVDYRAYELLLKARYLWHRRTRDALIQAVDLFEQAIEIEPRYADAYSGLGLAYAVIGFYDWMPPDTAFTRARAAANEALAINPSNSNAYVTRGYVALYYDWDWDESRTQFELGVENDVINPIAHQWIANYLLATRQFDQAITANKEAIRLDPLSLIASSALGYIHLYAGDPAAAVEQHLKTLSLDPNFVLAHFWLGHAYEDQGRYDLAIEQIERAAELSNNDGIIVAGLAHVYALAGRTEDARRLVEELVARQEEGYVPAFDLAKVFIPLGDLDNVFRLLEKAYEERSHSMAFLNVDPQLRPLRGDPRFDDLLERVGF